MWMGGFPIGRIKLRTDMLAHFPALAAQAKTEPVRDETKHRVELSQVEPALTRREMIQVGRVEFCQLERWDRSESKVEPLAEEELWEAIMVNSLHYDTQELWEENLRKIDLLLRQAKVHRLLIGTSKAEIIRAVNGLW